ncbi:hypothetical protein NPIL_62221 [Nephila pilipes]|uniref:Uncharacterized protein n=1 Tax=Nephila pilipes TaxID=299642 RepID=A0A8X6MXX8_NEPPI|nr:hypothetical protein NPIL_62221 [Nephila pilipes]
MLLVQRTRRRKHLFHPKVAKGNKQPLPSDPLFYSEKVHCIPDLNCGNSDDICCSGLTSHLGKRSTERRTETQQDELRSFLNESRGFALSWRRKP